MGFCRNFAAKFETFNNSKVKKMQARIFVLAAAMICAVSMAANNKVSGVIKDAADKSALIGVNVSLKQGDQQVSGTVTDAHGKFSLEAETGEFVLECSYIGYEPIGMSLAVSGNTHLGTIEMNEASTELSEVVVEGDAVIQKVDRQILLPNKEQLGASSDGMSLLQNAAELADSAYRCESCGKLSQDPREPRGAVAYQRHRGKQFRGHGD